LTRPVVGVLIMAYGTPATRADILPYYTHIRRGKAPTPELLKELEDRYEAIGGLSNLNHITNDQANAVHTRMLEAEDGVDYHLYIANKHWEPWIPDTIAQMAADGIKQAVALVLAPQGSKMSSGAYFDQVDKAMAELPDPFKITKIFNWHLEPGFIAAEVEKMEEALARFPGVPRAEITAVFTCHSLPERILTWGDPYPQHLREIGQAVSEACGLKKVEYAYQSAGRTPEPWLGPDIRDKITQLAGSGEKNVIVSSVGFISDHLEVIYDLDIEVTPIAQELGIHFERTGMLNDHPLLMQALADLLRREAHALIG